ncbi:Asp-tRNA(Asn)/Glu-tRNA(Gln) amidotransferase subunit GatA [Dyadobacter frigoris]|uniref:Glutamyl-tRNA(Gln) amidotransferase subunit A n=1 Tax=Dyadobacter frigoris TaxID=2576211 RepID=A0A4U6DBY4_9BACT|nr:Asp-tRNA(Asn)/Glu-tRNA(Gln) amidotransferase subunit GatA [Dyadobacter frigoris]TKT94315.1 Asp-tRNA(Asn)/Glu-tRNA(Gln) amidotransferase subunit GatA [Dyadobacter frigoris]GLU56651.1 glutamyl-tRNA(Gln) amidotransferase subunit A [Dyadobacter frigoris]
MKEYPTLTEIQNDLRGGGLTCVQLVNHYLERIESNAHLNAFVEVYSEEALRLASEIDIKIRNGTAGRLAGLIIGLKDVLSHKGHGVQAGSRILDSYIAPYTGTAVQRLLDEDAIVIGRQNCDEFAMGSSNESSSFGPVLNAADNSKVPGGSSGGSAVAVQAGLCHASLGSDTGGSVRQPAAFCGVIGVKPSYGRVSRYGLIAYASSFDCIGPITKSIEDAALLLEVMAGGDDFDSTVSLKEVPAYSKNLDWNGKAKIGYIRDTIENESIAPEIREQTLEVLNRLRASGHEVTPVEMPLLDYLLPTYYILTTAEASSNLSRFDGVRYGHRSAVKGDLEALYKNTRTEGFGEEVRRRILLGTFVLSANYYDAYYTKAQRVRRLVREETERFFGQFDFLISPVTPTTAFTIGEKTEDPLQMYLADIFTVQANVVGNPAVSIPNGVDKEGMPIGIQIMAPFFEEQKMLSFANHLSLILKENILEA